MALIERPEAKRLMEELKMLVDTLPEPKAAPDPGVYPGVAFRDYWSWPCVSSHYLEGFERSPAHAREYQLHPKDSTEALALGHAFHTFILEPHRFEQDYVLPPEAGGAAATKAGLPSKRDPRGKAIWAEWERAAGGRFVISREELEAFSGMKAALEAHPTAAQILEARGAQEVSLVWEDPGTKLPCKGRLDLLRSYGGYSWVLDLKTSRDARPRPFERDLAAYGYHRQLGFYVWGANVLMPLAGEAWRRAGLVVVEKERPYGVQVYELDELDVQQGQREMAAHLETLKHCLDSGSWPCYDGGLGLIGLPPWAKREML